MLFVGLLEECSEHKAPVGSKGTTCNIYKPKLFFLNDLCDTRILSKPNENSNPLTFRHPFVKNHMMMKYA